jgi:hypothetical protein
MPLYLSEQGQVFLCPSHTCCNALTSLFNNRLFILQYVLTYQAPPHTLASC